MCLHFNGWLVSYINQEMKCKNKKDRKTNSSIWFISKVKIVTNSSKYVKIKFLWQPRRNISLANLLQFIKYKG